MQMGDCIVLDGMVFGALLENGIPIERNRFSFVNCIREDFLRHLPALKFSSRIFLVKNFSFMNFPRYEKAVTLF